jgi:hypothetical protein
LYREFRGAVFGSGRGLRRGYAYLSNDITLATVGSLNGWNAPVNLKASRWFGLVFDFSGFYPNTDEDSTKAHTLLVGPHRDRPGGAARARTGV